MYIYDTTYAHRYTHTCTTNVTKETEIITNTYHTAPRWRTAASIESIIYNFRSSNSTYKRKNNTVRPTVAFNIERRNFETRLIKKLAIKFLVRTVFLDRYGRFHARGKIKRRTECFLSNRYRSPYFVTRLRDCNFRLVRCN